jgi:hypothetical protein
MTMNCCANESATVVDKSDETFANEISAACQNCLGHSRPVSRKTVLLMLKPELLEQAMTGTYNFCSKADCRVVYFDDQSGHSFTIDDLRIRVGIKASEDPISLCYCFGFDESHLRDEIVRTGRTTAPEKISRLIRQGLCACELRNPAGVCCLGEVNRAAKRLTSIDSPVLPDGS